MKILVGVSELFYVQFVSGSNVLSPIFQLVFVYERDTVIHFVTHHFNNNRKLLQTKR